MDPNPYQSPVAATLNGPLLDREARVALAGRIRQFLDDQTSAFEFDKALDEFRSSSDPTIRFVAQTVWYHYDDCRDHMVTLSKAEWDYFHRLLLLLQSDRQVAITSMRRWSWTQIVALGCLVTFGWCIWRFGWGQHLLAFSIPFGLVSIAISFLRRRHCILEPYDQILTPFASFAELSAAYRTTPGFTKNRYPQAITKRRIRSRVAEFGVQLQFHAAWLLVSPVPLLVQALPLTETRTHIDVA